MSTNLECERKFLVDPTLLPEGYDKNAYRLLQGYIINEQEINVRIRMYAKEDLTETEKAIFDSSHITALIALPHLFSRAVLTVKTEHSYATRNETEVNIAVDAGLALLSETEEIFRKSRAVVPYGGYVWEVDTYYPPLQPLVVAEVELDVQELYAEIDVPTWCTEEVTGDTRYSNAALASEARRRSNPLLTQ